MSNTKAASGRNEASAKSPRTRLDDLAPAGYELSSDEVELVAGGLGGIGRKVPIDDDATYIGGVPHPWD